MDMATESIDDMYDGCRSEAASIIDQFGVHEWHYNRNFSLAWALGERGVKKPAHGLLKEDHTIVMAIYVYTLDKPNVYLDFNNAVRTQRSVYATTFRYHSLHFFLTDALQKLNSRKPEAERCVTSYRRVDSYFSQGVLNKMIRFGSFTSSSMGWYPSADRFGEKSCFEIASCFGADISLYSRLGESEREVLIPPYEVFKVTKIERRSTQQSLPCEVVYKVKSTGKTLSSLNCALF
uniref:NAD(P)(+)--arginine ADP-ribosyltransferase n=1 Tax=Echeneis naucrates TaxID=173247 RepID=A0A665V1R4_ECHNA